jgi:hypothetical protein
MSKTLETFQLDGPHTGYIVIAVGRYYDNSRRAIQLLDAHDGSLVATATVNIPEAPIGKDEIFIKNWSENEGVLESMIDAGYIEPAHSLATTGRVLAECCKLTKKGIALWE